MRIGAIRKLLLGSLVLGAGATLACSSMARTVIVRLWPVEPYVHCTPDPRVFCEPGAEGFARAIASLMPAAIARVEGEQGGPFAGPIKVTVYSSAEGYARRSGGPQGIAKVSFGEAHLAPGMAARPDQYLPLLTHELSHLHLYHHVGALGMVYLPNWFVEGWPTLVSDGGGAGAASRDNAVFMLVHGRRFDARDSGTLFGRRNADARIPSGMYYRQASLMVGYMRERDGAAFARMVRDLNARKPFAAAVQDNYGQPLAMLWSDFHDGLRADPAAQWPGR